MTQDEGMTQARAVTRLRAMREAIGISQSELSRRTGIDQSLISRAERGRIDTWPRLRTSVARALEIPEHLHSHLPTREACEAAVRRIARSYGTPQLHRELHEQFPNRYEALDALDRINVRVTDVRLDIESIEAVRIVPVGVDGGDGAQSVIADCVADVRTRLSYQDAATGDRTVRPAGRASWRIRFESGTAR